MKKTSWLFALLFVVVFTFGLVGCASISVSMQRTTITSVPSTSTGGTGKTASAEKEAPAAVMDEEFISYDLHRYALVIGNGNYEEGALANPANDANLMAEKLAAAGFDVYRYYNLKKAGMDDAVSSFVKVVNRDKQSAAVVYYAGHGVEVDGVNYLIPIDNAKIESESDVKIYAYSLDNILSLLDAKEQIIILDACRNNPYKMSGDRAAGVKGGLGALKEAKKGVTMSYLFAAQSGQTAKDGEGGNSVFTAILAEEIEKGNVPISTLFNNVASRVKAMTNGEQVPLSSTTGSSFVFQSEELAKAVLAKWTQQLKQAEADLKKLESSKKSNDSDNAAELAAAQAKLALAQTEKEASKKRAEQVKADAKKAAEEAEAAKSRSADLQAKIDAMKMAAENAATQVRMNTVASATIMDAINEIENNKAKIVDINNQIASLSAAKSNELSVEYAKKAKEIDDAEYKKAELGSDRKPTAEALAIRQLRKDALKTEYDKMLADYTTEISEKMKGSDAGIIEIVKSEAETLGKTTYDMSSLTGGISISINQFDGSWGGWKLKYVVGNLVQGEILLSYETLTGKKRVTAVTDASQLKDYDEYMDNVEMFDSMFRGDVPVIVVEAQCHVVVGGGTLSYQVVPDSLKVRRIDTDTVVHEMNAQALKYKHGNIIIQSRTGLDIRSADEVKTSTITTKALAQYRDGVFETELTFLIGSIVGNTIVSDGYSPTDVIMVDDYYYAYPIGDRGPAGGWVFYDCDADNDRGNADGLISEECGWRYLEAAPSDIEQGAVAFIQWGDSGKFGTQTGIGTGTMNTEIIVSKASNSRTPNAATLCNDYTCDGYDDWFLPSKDELHMMYTNLHKAGLGGFAGYNGYYWSSSEGSSNSSYAWKQGFSNGTQNIDTRNSGYRVRPVRAF